MVVTFSSVGFGDIVPYSELGRGAVILSILAMLILIPTLTSDLLYALELKSNFAR